MAEEPNKIVAYGGRGPSKFCKVTDAVALGISTAAMHYSSPKRIAIIFIKDVNGIIVNIKTEWTDRDSRISTFVNILISTLEGHTVDDLELAQKLQGAQVQSPLDALEMKLVNGEIIKEEFEKKKKIPE